MATETTNYKFVKDASEDYYAIEKVNANLDKIDSAIKEVDLKSVNADTKIDAIKAEINEKVEEEVRQLNNDLENQKLLIDGFKASTTSFLEDGSITETNYLGTKVTTFLEDGSITETLTKTDETTITKTTTFLEDGSILEVIE